jgi:hypothetical protein
VTVNPGIRVTAVAALLALMLPAIFCQGPGRPIRFALLKTSGPTGKNDSKIDSHNELAD